MEDGMLMELDLNPVIVGPSGAVAVDYLVVHEPLMTSSRSRDRKRSGGELMLSKTASKAGSELWRRAEWLREIQTRENLA
jgi:hypothetical protein